MNNANNPLAPETTLVRPPAPTYAHLLHNPTHCPQCAGLLNTRVHCPKCSGPWCEECFCQCDHISAEHALAIAHRLLYWTPLTPKQSLLVQDDHGTVYASCGHGVCFVFPPEYGQELHFVEPEFKTLHEEHQHHVAASGPLAEARFGTDHWCAVIRAFEIDGRAFTLSVIEKRGDL